MSTGSVEYVDRGVQTTPRLDERVCAFGHEAIYLPKPPGNISSSAIHEIFTPFTLSAITSSLIGLKA